MNDALIGYSGFVGQTLLRQREFGATFRASDIHTIDMREFDTVVCASAPAQKWIANREPDADKENIVRLSNHLRTIRCRTFVLVSTVDVFKKPIGVDEESTVIEDGLHAYGINRRWLEKFVEQQFPQHVIVRLPGLVGPGLRKNVIYDFLNNNNLNVIDSRGVFQFYPTVNLWFDLRTAIAAKKSLFHFAAEPISVCEVSEQGFGRTFENHLPGAPALYDMRTAYAEALGGAGAYMYSRRDTLQATRAYAQSEPKKPIAV